MGRTGWSRKETKFVDGSWVVIHEGIGGRKYRFDEWIDEEQRF